ncbi:TIGR00255 family protein [Porphyromonas sp. oral taxon 278 str. W7784]|uniref:YicC/YloC family endoribonuclease n=1 Tax=Porphyromonas sp. oral taxon 278 TaxID=712437 RepID=UPI0003AD2F13|nr:YicC/YloC family endoribonuclease [Porphyromonas sp. oral taxon 278]ERJ72666.1 TIGR00255 family protein [Porphyromonas sp. oral taxon 278 str. W7784]
MIHSMTGFGKASARFGSRTITVAIKSLNSKQADISARIASAYREGELELRSLIADRLQRGKIDLTVTMEDDMLEGNATPINKESLLGYIHQLQSIRTESGLDFPIDPVALLRLPGVMDSESSRPSEVSKEEWEVVRTTTLQAIEELQSFRLQEGKMLREVCALRIEKISALLRDITFPEAERITAIRQRLEEGLAKIAPAGGYDSSRLEQEMIYYIEKLDINEEKSRLAHHLSYFLEVLDADAPGQGKTLGFIAQEIGREINTMGSKSNQAEMQQIVVKMKDELEQIKEQVLNIL